MKAIFTALILGAMLTGCASGRFKERQAQREKMATTSGMFCEFVSGDEFPDVDVEVSLHMAQRCDSNKPFSLTGYKNSSENFGVVYCCSIVREKPAEKAPVKSEKKEEIVTPPAVTPAPVANAEKKVANPPPSAKGEKSGKIDEIGE